MVTALQRDDASTAALIGYVRPNQFGAHAVHTAVTFLAPGCWEQGAKKGRPLADLCNEPRSFFVVNTFFLSPAPAAGFMHCCGLALWPMLARRRSVLRVAGVA